MLRTIYLFTNGVLKRRENTIWFETDEGKKPIPVETIQEIKVFGEVDFNKRLLEFLTQRRICIHFFNYYGYYVGSFYPREYLNSGYMTLRQAEFYLDPVRRGILARSFVSGAMGNILKNLAYYRSHQQKPLDEEIQAIETLKERVTEEIMPPKLMALEGNARNYYYSAFGRIIQNPYFAFDSRTRRPPQNPLNALISFGNSLLYTTALSEIYNTHLDPRIGYLHFTNDRSFSLNLDIAEIFKPVIVDRVIFAVVNRQQLKQTHFGKELEGVFLNDRGRKIFIQAYEEKLKSTIRHPKLKRNVSYRTLIRLECYKLYKHFMGEEIFKPFQARW